MAGWPSGGVSSTIDPSNTTVTWGAVAATAAGGLYRLCWCRGGAASPCASPGGFGVDVGAMALMGPAPLSQRFTCVSGRPCELTGIEGLGLDANDTLVVLSTCSPHVEVNSTTLWEHGVLPRFPEETARTHVRHTARRMRSSPASQSQRACARGTQRTCARRSRTVSSRPS